VKSKLFTIFLLSFLVSDCTLVGYNWPFMGAGHTYSGTNSSHDIIQILPPANVVIATGGEKYTAVTLEPSQTLRGRLSYNLTGTYQEVILDYKKWRKTGDHLTYLGHIAHPLYVSPENNYGTSVTFTDEGLMVHDYGCSSLICRWQ